MKKTYHRPYTKKVSPASNWSDGETCALVFLTGLPLPG